jgi:hypothetical protein
MTNPFAPLVFDPAAANRAIGRYARCPKPSGLASALPSAARAASVPPS